MHYIKILESCYVDLLSLSDKLWKKSCHFEKNPQKIHPDADDLQNLISSFLSTDACEIVMKIRSVVILREIAQKPTDIHTDKTMGINNLLGEDQ